MLNFRQFIEGYESPEYSEDDQAIIDVDIEERLRSRGKLAKNIKEEGQSNKWSHQKQEMSFKEGYTVEGKSYKVLNQIDLSMFEADIRKGELTKKELCEKYEVSKSTVNRYMKNYKEHGYAKYKKQINLSHPGDLIKKLLVQNQDLSKRIAREKGKHKQTNQLPYGTISIRKQNQQMRLY